MQCSSKKCKLVIMNKGGSFRSHQLIKAVIYVYNGILFIEVTEWKVLIYGHLWHIQIFSQISHIPSFLGKFWVKMCSLIASVCGALTPSEKNFFSPLMLLKHSFCQGDIMQASLCSFSSVTCTIFWIMLSCHSDSRYRRLIKGYFSR